MEPATGRGRRPIPPQTDPQPGPPRLTVIGAGPAYARIQGAVGACYLVEADGDALALDLGHGAFAGLAGRIPPERLDAVVISHLHPDHFVDLVPLRHWLRFHLEPPGEVRVLAPSGLASRLDGLHGQPGFATGTLRIEPLGPGSIAVASMTLEFRSVPHDGDSYAVRVSRAGRDRGLVYSGDVSAIDELAELVRPGDILLVEASFGPDAVPEGAAHLNAAAVADLATRTRPGRVLLTHILPDRGPERAAAIVRATFNGPVEVAEPGLVVAWSEE
jgi:ribonuclease BN (tRNA processing enzyme)